MEAALGLAGIRRKRLTTLSFSAPAAARSRVAEWTVRRSARHAVRASEAEPRPAAPAPATAPGIAHPFQSPRWTPWIFAAKTTASGLLALLVAFTFDLDQPKWALLTVFIVAQPQSGLVLAKSFYRVIGTMVGGAVALLLVALFAQERVLFLGALALWIGLSIFAAKRARNFVAYGFVLSGYTAAIVGISGALAPGSAFYIAVARVTEITIGVMTAAAVSRLVLPLSLADSLHRMIAATRSELSGYVASVLRGRDTAAQRLKLLGQAIASESLRASAEFDAPEIRRRRDALRRHDMAMLGVVDVAYLLAGSLDRLRRTGAAMGARFEASLARAAAAIDQWCSGALDADALGRCFLQASAELPIARDLFRDPSTPDDEVIGRAAAIARVRELLAAFSAFAEAHEVATGARAAPAIPVAFAVARDDRGAIWAGLRAALAIGLVGTFWIETAWPNGQTATIFATVMTALLPLREHAALAALGGTIATLLVAVPAFVLIEVVLPQASGFAMLTMAIAPMLFGCAWLLGREKTAGLGFIASLYVTSVGGIQNRMAYDPLGFVNTSIAQTLGVAAAAILLAIIDPDTAEAARRRFVRAARQAFARIAHARRPIGLDAFGSAMADALDQLRRRLRSDRAEDVAAAGAGIALLGVGRELIRVRDRAGRERGVEDTLARFLGHADRPGFARAQRAARDAAAACLAELRDDRLDVAGARAAAREMVAFAAIRDELDRATAIFEDRSEGVRSHAA